jgi:ATP-dependent DNA helicase Q1
MEEVCPEPRLAFLAADPAIEANGNGTVFFSAPLFRPNLHYKVLPKPASAKAAIERMGKFILDTYP